MTAASAADILIAATDLDDRLLECLADCRATLVRTFEEAQRALGERLFKMIVVDLNFDNVRMFGHDVDAAHRLGEIVEQTGHDVDFAYDGMAGLDAARRLRPDVVFLDLALPQLDGYEVARRLRREPGLRDVLIIALIAGSNGEDRQRLREAGFDQDVVKPANRRSIQKLLDAPLPQP